MLEHVIDADRFGDCVGRTVAGVQPSVCVTPRSIREVSLVVAEARRLGLVVAPTGGGSKLSLGNRPQRDRPAVGPQPSRRGGRIRPGEPGVDGPGRFVDAVASVTRC